MLAEYEKSAGKSIVGAPSVSSPSPPSSPVPGSSVSPLSVQSIATEADGSRTPAYTYNSNNEVAKDDIASRWHAQVGVRLTF